MKAVNYLKREVNLSLLQGSLIHKETAEPRTLYEFSAGGRLSRWPLKYYKLNRAEQYNCLFTYGTVLSLYLENCVALGEQT